MSNTSQNRRILVTSALPYANGPLHLGHLLREPLPLRLEAVALEVDLLELLRAQLGHARLVRPVDLRLAVLLARDLARLGQLRQVLVRLPLRTRGAVVNQGRAARARTGGCRDAPWTRRHGTCRRPSAR